MSNCYAEVVNNIFRSSIHRISCHLYLCSCLIFEKLCETLTEAIGVLEHPCIPLKVCFPKWQRTVTTDNHPSNGSAPRHPGQAGNLPLSSDPQKRSLPWPGISFSQQEQGSSVSLHPDTHLDCQVLSSAFSCVRGLPGKIMVSAREPCVPCKWKQMVLVLIISLVIEQNKAFEANSEIIITSTCKLCCLCLPVPGYSHKTHTQDCLDSRSNKYILI